MWLTEVDDCDALQVIRVLEGDILTDGPENSHTSTLAIGCEDEEEGKVEDEEEADEDPVGLESA